MPSLRVCLLGAPHVEREGVVLELGGHKNTALVAYLAATGQSHGREALATLLWPNLDTSRGRANLRRSLSELRKALGEEHLLADRETVGLSADEEVWLDVAEFRRLVQAWRGHGHPEAAVCAACAPGLTAAVELYRGDFLAGFGVPDSVAFDDWQYFETEGLRQELAWALEGLVGHLADQAALEEAISYARRWLALDALDERVQRRVMWLYAETGQRSAALRQYAECKRVLADELGVAPEEETTALYEAIRERRELTAVPQPISAPTSPVPKHNLPPQPIPFVGREAMLGEIWQRLGVPSCRLLTLVGPGGSGKTRLALETAGRHLDHFEDGVCFVALAPLESVEAIVPSMFQALGIPLYVGGDPRQQLLSWLREKDLLLVLDNYEHLLAGAEPGGTDGAELVSDLLSFAPKVKVLATSRSALKLQDEHLFPVGGMDYPGREVEGAGQATPDAATRYSAVRLFVQGARQVEPAFELMPDNVTEVTHICELVDGMPLAILLATAWIKMLTPGEIEAEISRSLDFLETDMRDVPERHRSLRAVFDHSWALLTPREREVMQGLSVFRGGFTCEAARAVTGASLRTLLSLVDKSFLSRRATASRGARRRGRFELHELLRQYAARELAESVGVAQHVRDQHCAFFGPALRRWGMALKSPGQAEALGELDVEIDNARAAWDWAAERGHVARLDEGLEGLCRFYEIRSRRPEGEAACRAAASHLSSNTARDAGTPDGAVATRAQRLRVLAKVLAWRACFTFGLGRGDEAAELLDHALALIERPELAGADVRAERALVLLHKGHIEENRALREARQSLEEALALCRELGDRWGEAQALYDLGWVYGTQVSRAEGRRALEGSVALRRSVGDLVGTARAISALSYFVLDVGRADETEGLIREGLAISHAIRDQLSLASGIMALGAVRQTQGAFAEAHSLVAEALEIKAGAGDTYGSEVARLRLSATGLEMGHYEQARNLAQRCAIRAGEMGLHELVAGAHRVLGAVALARRDYRAAELLFRGGLGAMQADIVWVRSDLAIGQAHAARGLGRRGVARRHLRSALCTEGLPGLWTVRTGDWLPIAALLCADQGDLERAVELWALASSDPQVVNSRWSQDVVGKEMADIEARLPQEVVTAAQERGRAREPEATRQELLTELADV